MRVEGIPDFWNRVRAAHRWFLALDYDGTLAPFTVDRMKAFPLEGVLDCLSAIARSRDTRLVIVSGRVADEVVELLRPVRVTVVGSHGREIREADGTVRRIPPDPRQEEMLVRALEDATGLGHGGRAERKAASVAVHTRGLSRTEADRVETRFCGLWEPQAEARGMECRRFNGGVELRAKGVDKGTALCELLGKEPPDCLAVYVGDDETDEDAFREVRNQGFGIKVGPEGVSTLAQGRLPDCRAVLDLLREWIRVTSVG